MEGRWPRLGQAEGHRLSVSKKTQQASRPAGLGKQVKGLLSGSFQLTLSGLDVLRVQAIVLAGSRQHATKTGCVFFLNPTALKS